MLDHNIFPIKKDGELWVITLCPAFEFTCSREEANKIPLTERGIYRYMQGEEIVYIGRGFIKSRLNEEERSQWRFDRIEYSIIEDEKEAEYWESYWIEIFKEKNSSVLPYYNKISGCRINTM